MADTYLRLAWDMQEICKYLISKYRCKDQCSGHLLDKFFLCVFQGKPLTVPKAWSEFCPLLSTLFTTWSVGTKNGAKNCQIVWILGGKWSLQDIIKVQLRYME